MSLTTRNLFQSTLTGRATRTHTCTACGCAYRTVVERTASDEGGIESVARERAAQRLASELRGAAGSRPCPTCGLIPPGVWVHGSRPRHLAVWFAAAILPTAAAGLAAAGWLPVFVAAPVALILVGIGVMLHRQIATAADPNRQREQNLADAQAAVADGSIQIVHRGNIGSGMEPRTWIHRQTLGVAISAAAPLILLVPAFVRGTLNLPANSNLRPSIVTAGTTFDAALPSPTFRSVNGWWSATAKVDVLNAGETGAPTTLTAFTHPPAWGDKSAASDAARTAPTDLHVTVTLPDDPALAGQTLQLKATLNVVYPAHMSKSGIDKSVATVTHEFPASIASRAQSGAFTLSLVAGGAGCLVATFLGGWLLTSGLATLKRQYPVSDGVRPDDLFTI